MSSLLIPMKLECFVFNESVCNGGEQDAKIAPITQPDYSLLQYDNRFLSSDVLRHVDLHASSPASTNMRFKDLGADRVRKNRQGVYIHWTLPRPYRAAAFKTQEKASYGLPPGTKVPGDEQPETPDSGSGQPTYDPTIPSYYDVPPRWLVIRQIKRDSIFPESARDVLPEFRAWVVESDVRRSIDELDETVDLQVDVSPYIAPESGENGSVQVDMQAQAEVFIGQRFPAETWAEKSDTARVRLNLFNSSNQLFADYQPHNGNVFSILDKFEYKDAQGEEQCLEAAMASYYVIGWQPDIKRDLFVAPTYQSPDDLSVRKEQLRSLNVSLESDKDGATGTWQTLKEDGQTLCHGAMYDVEWDTNRKPTNMPSDQACSRLMKQSPIAVGMTPMDCIMAYVVGHSETSKGDMHELEMDLLKLQTLLLDRDEGVEPQRRAANVLNNLNFQRQEGGKKYFLSHPEEQGNAAGPQATIASSKSQKHYEPTKEEIDGIAAMNEKQAHIDSLARSLKNQQWELFAHWWTLLTDSSASTRSERYRGTRRDITTAIGDLDRKIQELERRFGDTEIVSDKVQNGTSQPFHQAGDPTVLVAGVQSGWPVDFLDPLKVRLRHQIIGATKDGKLVAPALPEDLEYIIARIGAPWQTDMRYLVSEFLLLGRDTDFKAKPEQPAIKPLYHDIDLTAPICDDDEPQTSREPRWRDRWHGTQPWAPLYLEWEVEYVHIPYDPWTLDHGEQSTSLAEDPKLRYFIRSESLVPKDLEDRRRLSGRVLMLPQPTASLKNKIIQLFQDTPAPLLNEILPEADREFVLKQVDQMSLLSAPLAGFTDLITRRGGTHVKPTYRQPNRDGQGGQLPKAIPDAIVAARFGDYSAPDLILMGLETDITPYGTGVSFTKDQKPPFKPATHGQFCFTKLNIIDKFGQAIHAVSPNAKDSVKIPKLYTSEYLRAQKLVRPISLDPVGTLTDGPTSEKPSSGGRGDASHVRSEFAQIPPQINQPARINAEFVSLHEERKDEQTGRYWKPVSQWEQPVWGWVMINYPNYGLQFFTSQGEFYQEVRFGGPTGSMASPNWMTDRSHLDPKDHPDVQQLQALLDNLADKESLRAFIESLNGAMKYMLPAPAAFSEFTSAIVGQPLALVNMGLSIELSVAAYTTHATLGNDSMPKRLTPDPRFEDSHTPEDQLYKFQVKLGDKTKAYDGLVGYWNVSRSPKVGDGLDLKTLYTYYTAESDPDPETGPVRLINKRNFPKFKPYYLNPGGATSSSEYSVQHCQKLQVFGAIIDPFTPVHAYSSILPVRELKLSPWMCQRAFRNMTAFFHMGPLLITDDFMSMADDNGAVKPNEDGGKPVKVNIPTNSLAEWEWLQPFKDDQKPFPDSVQVKSFEVAPVDLRPRLEPNPYTAIEGYLRLNGPAPVKGEGQK